jgi:hypothetical protein
MEQLTDPVTLYTAIDRDFCREVAKSKGNLPISQRGPFKALATPHRQKGLIPGDEESLIVLGKYSFPFASYMQAIFNLEDTESSSDGCTSGSVMKDVDASSIVRILTRHCDGVKGDSNLPG